MEDLEFNVGGKTIKIAFPGDEPKKEKLDLNHIIPQLTKSKGGLYPHEILMLNQVSWYKTNSENRFAWFWENEWGINPQLLIDKLFNEGFIGVEDTRTTISRLTVPEIKEFLKEYGCKLSGNKPELLDRLFSECDVSAIGSTITQRRYCLTDKGKEEVRNLLGDIDDHYDLFISSDLVRTKETSLILNSKLNMEIKYDSDFRETNNGDLKDLTKQEFNEKYNGLYFSSLKMDQCYPNGESPNQFYKRIKDAFIKLLEENKNKKILLVTHGGVITVIMCLIYGLPYSNLLKITPKTGTILKF